MRQQINIIRVLQGRNNKNCLVSFQIGEDFYDEKFDCSQIGSDERIGIISPHSDGFNLFFANNRDFKKKLFEVINQLNQNKSVHFPITVNLEWKDFVLKKKELQVA